MTTKKEAFTKMWYDESKTLQECLDFRKEVERQEIKNPAQRTILKYMDEVISDRKQKITKGCLEIKKMKQFRRSYEIDKMDEIN